jgi:CpeT/CpcT family (DUF1001)
VTKLEQLQSWLTGTWSNRTQAFSQPAAFAHVVLEIQASGFPNSLLLTQRYKREPKPYRERYLVITQGASKSEFLVNTRPVDDSDSKDWDACVYKVRWNNRTRTYSGSIPFCQGCVGEHNGKKYCLIASLELQRDRLATRDQGVDPVTKEHIWGQRLHPFVFDRVV